MSAAAGRAFTTIVLVLLVGYLLLVDKPSAPEGGSRPILHRVERGETYGLIAECLGQPDSVSHTAMAEELETINGSLRYDTDILIPKTMTGGKLCYLLTDPARNR